MVTTISFIFKINKNTTKAIPKHPRRNYREYCFHSLLVTGSQKGWCAMVGQYDEKYLRKCHKRLRELGAPLENWSCTEVEDGETADFICELCGCDRVRFIHVMAHADYDGVLQVGCVCAGYMEGDLIAAKERDDAARRKSSRRANFRKKVWTENSENKWSVKYKHHLYLLNEKNSVAGIFTKSASTPTSINGGRTAVLKLWKMPSRWSLN